MLSRRHFFRLARSSRRQFCDWQCYQDDIFEVGDVMKKTFLRLAMLSR